MVNLFKVLLISVLSVQSESFFGQFQPRKKNYSIHNGISNSENSDFVSDGYLFASEYYEYLIKFNKISQPKKMMKFLNLQSSTEDKHIEIAKSRERNYRIFERNFINIKEFNEEGKKFKLNINKFTDIVDFNNDGSSYDDLMKKTLDKKQIMDYDFKALKQVLQNPTYYVDKYNNISNSLNWYQYISDVKDQGPCGSCWAFSTTGALEGYMRANNYNVTRLSEQELVDCSYENYGCGGGLMHLAFDYIISEKGMSSNDVYPYTARDGSCKCKEVKQCNCDNDSCDCDCDHKTNMTLITEHVPGSNISDFMFTIPRSISDLMASLKYSPISIALDASPFEFRFYDSGVIDIDPERSSSINHAVLLVGYDHDEEGPYWIIQNSWGKEWGDNGFAKIRIKNGDGVLLSQLYGVYPKY